MRGRTRCWRHGGKSLVGPASPHYQTGRYSKYLPTRMAAKYREAEKDPDLLSLREEVKALDARIGDVLTRVDTGESGVIWQKLHEAFEEFRIARAAGNTPANVAKMQAALAQVETYLSAGAQDWHAWGHVAQLWEQRRKLVESENKIMLARKYFISHEQGMIMMGKITDSITRHAMDLLPIELSRKFLTAVTVDLQQVMVQEPSGTPVYGVAEAEG
jgi:hypothetical protein